MDMKAMGEVRLDGVESASQPSQIVLGAAIGVRRSARPTSIEIRIAVEAPNSYSGGQNRRSSGECRLKQVGEIDE